MLFNSYIYIFLFLPIAFAIYFFLNRGKLYVAANSWLVFTSLFFYAWWDVRYLPILLSSILFNYTVGQLLLQTGRKQGQRKTWLGLGVISNLGLLGYFKYADFFIGNYNFLFDTSVDPLKIALPLAISFFTFQQISYLVDSYYYKTSGQKFLHYSLFVSFFPQLIAGPIVRHHEMMPQFAGLKNKSINYQNIATGITIFFIGLFKKTVIADAFAKWANFGFDVADRLYFIESWITSLSYTFQLYFDFSGYTDMAIGAALLLNIHLPINFNSPYKARNIQDFWRRWHITLSRFLRDYLYIPLGGGRHRVPRAALNMMIVFLLGGLWHGASWTFIFWGLLHGLAAILHRLWIQLGWKMNRVLAWFIKFNFVNVAWIFFRARTWGDAAKVLKGMVGMGGAEIPEAWDMYFIASKEAAMQFHGIAPEFDAGGGKIIALYLMAAFALTIFGRNSFYIKENFKPSFLAAIAIAAISAVSLLYVQRTHEFIYFQF